MVTIPYEFHPTDDPPVEKKHILIVTVYGDVFIGTYQKGRYMDGEGMSFAPERVKWWAYIQVPK